MKAAEYARGLPLRLDHLGKQDATRVGVALLGP